MRKISKFQRNLILTLGISISILTILIVLINYITMRQELKVQQDKAEQLIEANVVQAIESSDAMYSIIEESLSQNMEKYTKVLIDTYKKNPNIDTWDLDQFKKRFDGYEIFILDKDLIITHSTRKDDLGLDFKEFGLEDLLTKRLLSGKFETDRLEVSEATKQANKFSYQGTPDQKYIIELGATEEHLQNLFDGYDIGELTSQLENDHNHIKDISIYTVQDDGTPEHSINKFDEQGNSIKINNELVKKGEEAIKTGKTEDFSKKINSKSIKFRFIAIGDKDNTTDSYKQLRLLVIQYDEDSIQQLMSKNNILSTIIVIISMILSISLSIIIGKRVSKPVEQIGKLIDRTSNLEFTDNEHLNSLKERKDDFGELAIRYETMLSTIRSAFIKVIHSSSQLAAMSEQFTASSNETKDATGHIASAIQDVSDQVDQQTATVQEAIADIVSITEEIKHVSQNVHEVNTLVTDTVEISNSGKQTILESAQNMQRIHNHTKHSNSLINQLNDKSTEIERISYFITSIAEQTNLLALNAAIESARAGESGKGFAVVADEVRKLAVESSQAANQINSLIMEIKNEISEAMQSMEEGYEAVQEGNILTEKAGHAFSEIIHSVDIVSDKSKETASISRQVSTISENLSEELEKISNQFYELNTRAEEVASTTEEQTAIIQDMTDGATNLSSIAEDLKTEVDQFKID